MPSGFRPVQDFPIRKEIRAPEGRFSQSPRSMVMVKNARTREDT